MIGDLIHEKYIVKSILEEGSSHHVYLVEDLQFQKQYSLRCIFFHPDEAKDLPVYEKQLLKLKQHYHPQIPKIFEIFSIDDLYKPQICLITEYLEGETLSQIVSKNKLSELETIDIMIQLTRVVEYLHSLTPPFIHQAIQPSNLLLTDKNKLYLTGYSLTRESEDGKKYPLNMSLDYTAPEQMRGEPLPLSDLYGVGVTGIELVSGKKMSQIIDGDFYSQSIISTEFSRILTKLSAEQSENRHPTASLLKNELISLRNLSEEKQKNITTDVALDKKQMVIPIVAGILALAGLFAFLILPLIMPSITDKTSKTSLSNGQEQNNKRAIEHSVKSKNGHISLSQKSIQASKSLNISFKDTPGNITDWISISPKNTPKSDWETRFPLKGVTQGALKWKAPKRTGEYTVRLYHNWPAGQFIIQDEVQFSVTGSGLPAANGEFPPVNVNIYEAFTYKTGEHPPGIPAQTIKLPTQNKPGEEFLGAPSFDSEQVTYGTFLMGNSEDPQISFAVSKNIIHLDAQNTNELPETGKDLGTGNLNYNLNVKLIDTQGMEFSQPYQVNLSYNTSQGYRLSSLSYYKGQIEVGSKTLDTIAFEASDINGLYRDNGLWIDLNQNKQFDSQEHFYHNDLIKIEEQNHQLKLLYP